VLFFDTDQAVAPAAVLRMLAADKHVIGAVTPYRSLPLHAEIAGSGETLRQVVATTVPYAVWFAPGTEQIAVLEGVCEVEAIGAGLLLVRRDALQAMVDAGVAEAFLTSFPYSQWYRQTRYHGFFVHMLADGAFLGEDISFCRRWKACGGTIHALCDEEIMHVGPIPVVGRYFDKLKAGRV